MNHIRFLSLATGCGLRILRSLMKNRGTGGLGAANSNLGTTRDRVSDLRRTNPSMAAVEIATVLQVTRQRVHQILKDLKLPTSIPKMKAVCPQCGEQMSASRAFCSWACRDSASRTTFKCGSCRRNVQALKSDLHARVRRGTRRFFCSRRCKTDGSIGQRGGRHA